MQGLRSCTVAIGVALACLATSAVARAQPATGARGMVVASQLDLGTEIGNQNGKRGWPGFLAGPFEALAQEGKSVLVATIDGAVCSIIAVVSGSAPPVSNPSV